MNEDERYIQLNDVKYESQGQSGERLEVVQKPKPARIVVDTEIRVRTHETI